MVDDDGETGASESPRFPAWALRQVGASMGTICNSETGQDSSVGPTWPGPALTLVGSGDPSQGCISTHQLHGNKNYVEKGQRGGSLGRKPWGGEGGGVNPTSWRYHPCEGRPSAHLAGRGHAHGCRERWCDGGSEISQLGRAARRTR